MNNPLNSVLLEGNLTRDPELSQTPNGTPVCDMAVASNRYYKLNEEQQKEVSFFPVEAWSKLAENCAEYLVKGREVRVVGRLKQDRWQNKEGDNRSRIKIVAEHVEFKSKGSNRDVNDGADGAKEGEEQNAGEQASEAETGAEAVADEVPFYGSRPPANKSKKAERQEAELPGGKRIIEYSAHAAEQQHVISTAGRKEPA